MKTIRRGYLPEYEHLFRGAGIAAMKEAAIDALFMLNRGYTNKRSTQIATEHYQLADVQRLALSRVLDSDEAVRRRAAKRLKPSNLMGRTVYIDGFNAIILMESLVSLSPVFKCLDWAIRDLANLKGSYRIIDKTEQAIRLILSMLDRLQVSRAVFNIDSPVSNSRNLRAMILSLADEYSVSAEVNLVDACDKSFYGMDCVISGDCIVLDNAETWAPLYAWIAEDFAREHPDAWLIDFSAMNLKI